MNNYEPLTQQEKEEAAIAASNAYLKYANAIDSKYGVKENKSNVDSRKSRIMLNVKNGLVEITDHSMIAERLRNGSVWIPKAEAERRELEYRDHTKDVLGEMCDLGRIGTMKEVISFR